MSPQTFKNYINGEWVGSGKTLENRNPANTDEIVGLFSKGTTQDVADAAAAAAAAFPAWSAMPAPARGNLLYKAADIMARVCRACSSPPSATASICSPSASRWV